jgi:hypothetical protein
MSMKNSNDIIGNRTRNLLACCAVPQSTAPPGAPISNLYRLKFCIIHISCNYIIFTKNQTQTFAQYSILFAVRSPTCFGQIYWPSSRSHEMPLSWNVTAYDSLRMDNETWRKHIGNQTKNKIVLIFVNKPSHFRLFSITKHVWKHN